MAVRTGILMGLLLIYRYEEKYGVTSAGRSGSRL
jgi:hypothetical protein